ncbi:MAG: glycosyltransferase family 4 protein [Candidatus Sulfotelmatobacter sp.]
MNFDNSRLVRLLKLFQRKGLRHGINAMAMSLARRHLSVPNDVLANYQLVLTADHPENLSTSRPGPLRINWILPGIATAHGGLFNIFRAIQELEKWGHENRVYMLEMLPGGHAVVRDRIRKEYFSINADVEVFSDKMKDSDALVATSWPTAYAARGVGNTGQKFYFVQDLEYMFYAAGSLHEFARQTYQFGFHGITAGSWIADVLRRKFNMECSVFGFSYDRHAYGNTGVRLLPFGKKRVLFYARPETERRGFELGLLTLSLVAESMPDIEFVLAGFSRGSLDLPFPAVFPGVLPISALGALYRSCDVALVLSHTNLSLLPLELMACGCAVVSNKGPNTEWLLTDQTAQLARADPKSLAQAVIELLQNDRVRLQKIEAAIAFVESTDWTREIRAIESALLTAKENKVQMTPHG